jgi:hypothetical protein
MDYLNPPMNRLLKLFLWILMLVTLPTAQITFIPMLIVVCLIVGIDRTRRGWVPPHKLAYILLNHDESLVSMDKLRERWSRLTFTCIAEAGANQRLPLFRISGDISDVDRLGQLCSPPQTPRQAA